jgi:hypothetical protein
MLKYASAHQVNLVSMLTTANVVLTDSTYEMRREYQREEMAAGFNRPLVAALQSVTKEWPSAIFETLMEFLDEPTGVVFTTLSEEVLSALRTHLFVMGHREPFVSIEEAYALIYRHSPPHTRVIDDDEWLDRPRRHRAEITAKYAVLAVADLLNVVRQIRVISAFAFTFSLNNLNRVFVCLFGAEGRAGWRAVRVGIVSASIINVSVVTLCVV